MKPSAHYDPEDDRIDREWSREQEAQRKRTPRLLALRDRINAVRDERHWGYETAMDLDALALTVEGRLTYGRDCTEDGEVELLKRLSKIRAWAKEYGK